MKTLSGGDRCKVDPRPVATIVAALGSLAVPRTRPGDGRVAPTELTTFRVRAALVGALDLRVAAFVTGANAAFGLLFGHLYWRWGLESAMIAHALAHTVNSVLARLL